MPKNLYVFLDESGNLDFSKSGSEHFIITSLLLERPFPCYNDLIELRYDLLELGHELELFHATEDRQMVRNKVFEIINANLNEIRLDSLIVRKRRTATVLQGYKKFYPEMVGYLLRFVLKKIEMNEYDQIIVVTDTIPLQKKKSIIEGETKRVLKELIPKEKEFKVMHHSSKSNVSLQVVDYCCWAIFRKWERNDTRSYDLIREALASEFDIFRNGKINYY
ncbi:MAG: DUF3800 domain-containing protein [Balneolaceae bacterium]